MKKKRIPIFSLAVYERIRETIGKLPPESGGLICGNPKTNCVTYYYFDDKAECSSVVYIPDTITLIPLLKKLNDEGLEMMGFPHSHPSGCDCPSTGDKFYASKIFEANPDMRQLIIPIIESAASGQPFQMRVFIATPRRGEVEIKRVPLHVCEIEMSLPEVAPPPAEDAKIIIPNLTKYLI